MSDITKNLDFNGSPEEILATTKAVLEYAIQKAIDGGWKPLVDGKFLEVSNNKFTGELHLAHEAPWNNDRWALGQSVASALIDHNFAKALWGEAEQPIAVLKRNHLPEFEESFRGENHTTIYKPKWQAMLMMMALAADPIAYLGTHI